MEIRLAAPGDIPGLTNLLLQVGQVHHEIRPDIFRDGCLKYTENELNELIKDDSKPIFVAISEDTVQGYCFCQIRQYDGTAVFTNRKELYIDDLCVDQTARGTGVAKALYVHAHGYAEQIGCQFVTLNVWCGNDRAMAFYEKMGLRPRNIMLETALSCGGTYADQK